MPAYYNEIDPYAAQWLRNLIDAGHIAPGDVDERSIVDVRSSDLAGYDQCHFFAGVGGWSLALRLAGVADSERIWTGSCPCQPFSAAGKRKGTADERHLWPEFRRLIAECNPPVVLGEQVSRAATAGWLDDVAGDLEAVGYAVGSAVLPASVVGAPHRRDRLWFVADAQWNQQPRPEPCGRSTGRMGREQQPVSWDEPWQRALSRLRAVDDGLPRSVAATDAARNAIVPQVAAEFISAFQECRP